MPSDPPQLLRLTERFLELGVRDVRHVKVLEHGKSAERKLQQDEFCGPRTSTD